MSLWYMHDMYMISLLKYLNMLKGSLHKKNYGRFGHVGKPKFSGIFFLSSLMGLIVNMNGAIYLWDELSTFHCLLL